MDFLGAADDTNCQVRGLSLSLGTHVPYSSVEYRHRTLDSDLMIPNYSICGEDARGISNMGGPHLNEGYSFAATAFGSTSASLNHSSSSSYGGESFVSIIGNSRYLKPTQSLLEEIVNVGKKATDIDNDVYAGKLSCVARREGLDLSAELRAELCNKGLLQAEKHEYQLKITKLISLLEEVEGRYEIYYRQMEGVKSSFEEMAGSGAAKSYTALALQAMSRHFCSLRDAIVFQINTEKRKLLQTLPLISTGLSQLSLFDNRETRNNRTTLQQAGMIHGQRKAWRPIRGLPETSVSMLRSWLFEHFLHPYPNESEKLMLSSQTGLSKNQVSNWFINARVRLWKPMIEDMYKEEFGDSSKDSNSQASCSILEDGSADFADD